MSRIERCAASYGYAFANSRSDCNAYFDAYFNTDGESHGDAYRNADPNTGASW